MIHAIRSVRISHPLPPNFGHKASLVRFKQVSTSASAASREPDRSSDTTHNNMDKGKEENPKEKFGDVMSHSFGEGYATRSDDEGFGGIYGGSHSIPKDEKDQSCIHENHPEYDKTQGSEVKEKEKARFQTSADRAGCPFVGSFLPKFKDSPSPLSQISSPWMIFPGFCLRIPVDLFPIYRSVVVSRGFGYGRDSSVSPPMIFKSRTISMLVLRSEKTLREGRFSPLFSADLALSMCGGILGVFFGFLEGMYKISETEGPREAEVPINLCHPTFAMTDMALELKLSSNFAVVSYSVCILLAVFTEYTVYLLVRYEGYFFTTSSSLVAVLLKTYGEVCL
ncbi:hypothetical protein TIFTF001_002449 [Ficus carica]|uniref:Uncharacterized protein n=1 Tax=Ficus carica TaxID=3494 RepID=A0AA88D7P4_FICCA|nr:hypothetical protein TIFTF001_002449 [Ficus carica]